MCVYAVIFCILRIKCLFSLLHCTTMFHRAICSFLTCSPAGIFTHSCLYLLLTLYSCVCMCNPLLYSVYVISAASVFFHILFFLLLELFLHIHTQWDTPRFIFRWVFLYVYLCLRWVMWRWTPNKLHSHPHRVRPSLSSRYCQNVEIFLKIILSLNNQIWNFKTQSKMAKKSTNKVAAPLYPGFPPDQFHSFVSCHSPTETEMWWSSSLSLKTHTQPAHHPVYVFLINCFLYSSATGFLSVAFLHCLCLPCLLFHLSFHCFISHPSLLRWVLDACIREKEYYSPQSTNSL